MSESVANRDRDKLLTTLLFLESPAVVVLHIGKLDIVKTNAKAGIYHTDERFSGDAGIEAAEHRAVKGDVMWHSGATRAEQAIYRPQTNFPALRLKGLMGISCR